MMTQLSQQQTNNDYFMELKILDERYTNGVFELPNYATSMSSGIDFLAAIDSPVTVEPFETVMIKSGLSLFINCKNIVLFLLPRSGLGSKKGVILGNTVGVIDPDYQGEILICIYNRSKMSFTINPGDHICQGVFLPTIHGTFKVVNEFTSITERNVNGFGHSR